MLHNLANRFLWIQTIRIVSYFSDCGDDSCVRPLSPSTGADKNSIGEDGKTVGLEIHIGWNRVVRRIFESLEYQVVKLDGTIYAGLDKKDLPRGTWRHLREEEVIRLKHLKRGTR